MQLDDSTVKEYPHSFVMKLDEPLDEAVVKGDELLVADEIIPPITEDVILVPPAEEEDPLVRIKEQELQLRQQEMVADQQSDQQKLALDQQRAQQNFQLGRDRIDSTEDIAQMRARIALQKQNQTRG